MSEQRFSEKCFFSEIHSVCERWAPHITLADLIAALESEKFFHLQMRFKETLEAAEILDKNNEPINKNSIRNQQRQSIS